MRNLFIFTLLLSTLVACAVIDKPFNPDNPFADAEQNQGRWVWLPIEDSVCRDGSSTGIGVRLQQNAQGVMIYLQGGGFCFDAQSCKENAEGPVAGENYSNEDFGRWANTLGTQGVFNVGQAANPVATWHHVFVPYCTGDIHGGRKANASIEGVPNKQQFMGYQNINTYLDLLAPYFKDTEELVLAGASAGGFGVLLNYPQVAEAFEPKPVTALVDAAAFLDDDAIALSCFQDKLINTFNLRLPENCLNCTQPAQGGLSNLYTYLTETYSQGTFAWASADADLAGVTLLDQESKACDGAGVDIFKFSQAQFGLRDTVLKPTGQWSTFFWGGLEHTFTQTNNIYLSKKVKGTTPAAWFREVMSGKVIHIAP